MTGGGYRGLEGTVQGCIELVPGESVVQSRETKVMILQANLSYPGVRKQAEGFHPRGVTT